MIISTLITASFLSFSAQDFIGFKDDAAKTLQHCVYLHKTYPESYAKIQSVSDKTMVILSEVDIKGVAAIAVIPIDPTITPKIFISDYLWDDKNPRFNFGVDYKKVMAHELLHLIGLPNHKVYKTYEEYKFNDEIEFTIKACFINE